MTVHWVGARRLQSALAGVQLDWLALAVALAALAQVVSVFRWVGIARIFRLKVDAPALGVAYAQGMTLNAVLPGATLGGDALRSLRLQALGNPIGLSALTVLIDRLSGLWVLCVLSFTTGSVLFAVRAALAPEGVTPAAARQALDQLQPGLGAYGTWLIGAFLLAFGAACALPWVPIPARVAIWSRREGLAAKVLATLVSWHDLTRAQAVPLARSLGSSVAVQVLCAANLWACSRAAGGTLDYWQIQIVAAAVFVAGALPFSYGGFGARELVAVVCFPLIGGRAELGLAASALYGSVGVFLGLLTAPAFVVAPRRHDAPAPDQP